MATGAPDFPSVTIPISSNNHFTPTNERNSLVNKSLFRIRSDTWQIDYHYLDDEKITILVGPEKKTFKLLKNVVFAKAPILANHATQVDGSIHLSNIDPIAFKAIEDWLYDDKLPEGLSADDSAGSIGPSREVYAAAVTLQLHDLHNQIIDYYWRDLATHPTSYLLLTDISLLQQAGLTNTASYRLSLRSSVEALMTGTITPDAWQEALQEFDRYPEAMRDILVHVHQWAKGDVWKSPGRGDRCDYHIHKDGYRCGPDSGPDAPLIDSASTLRTQRSDVAILDNNGEAGERGRARRTWTRRDLKDFVG